MSRPEEGYRLIPFPRTPGEQADPDLDLFADPRLTDSGLQLVFRLEERAPGVLDSIQGLDRIVNQVGSEKHEVNAVRADRLWEETCFECFFLVGEGEAYYEWNATADGRWNLYAFDSYRKGMRELEVSEGGVPYLQSIQKTEKKTRRVLSFVWFIPRSTLPFLERETRLGLSAVVEQLGVKTYWAIDHLRPEADFHFAESFTARLRSMAEK